MAQEKEAEPPPGSGDEATPPPSKEAEPAAEPPSSEPPAATPAEQPPSAEPPKEGEPMTPTEQAAQAGANGYWQDIVVAQRRPVLKRRRIEFMPTYNVSMNSPMVRHHGIGGQLNVYLSEAFFLGVEGTYYRSQVLDRYFLIGLDERVLPSVNQYIWSALLDFGYVPIYGKFTLFNSAVLHWETYISAGVGVFQSQVIPRDPQFNGFSNILVAGLLPGIGARLWVNKWFALDAYFKNYLFADKLEPTQRTPGDCDPVGACPAKDAAESQFTFNIVFGVGLSIFLPPGFEYKTPR